MNEIKKVRHLRHVKCLPIRERTKSLDKSRMVLYNPIQILVWMHTTNCMEYRIDKQGLLATLTTWDGFLGRTVRLIACGGTAMTLLGIKESTKDVDLLVPDLAEYKYLRRTIEQLGYKSVTGSGWAREGGFIFELFRGKSIGNGAKVYQNQRSKSLPVRYADRGVADAQMDRAERYAIIL